MSTDTSHSLKELMISLLGEHFPLPVKEIRLRLEDKSQHKFTTQAIHKSLSALMSSRAVLKIGHAYELTPAYILNLEETARALRYRYFSKPSSFKVAPDNSRTFTEDSLADLDKLWNRIIEEILLEYPARSFVHAQLTPHAWFNLAHMGDETRIVNLITSRARQFYTLVNGNSPLDKWVGQLYAGKNSHYAMRAKTARKKIDHQYSVIGNHIIEARYPKDVALRLDRLFGTTSELGELSVPELISIIRSPVKISLTVHNNPKKAKAYLAEIMTEFK